MTSPAEGVGGWFDYSIASCRSSSAIRRSFVVFRFHPSGFTHGGADGCAPYLLAAHTFRARATRTRAPVALIRQRMRGTLTP